MFFFLDGSCWGVRVLLGLRVPSNEGLCSSSQFCSSVLLFLSLYFFLYRIQRFSFCWVCLLLGHCLIVTTTPRTTILHIQEAARNH